MGFNLGGSITGALAGSLLGPVGAIAGGIGGGLLGGEGGDPSVKFQQIPQSPEAIKARTRLSDIAEEGPPEVPLQGVAPLPEMTEERQLARETGKELIQQQDIFSLPEVQAIISEARRTGDLLANRIGRALQTTGNITSTSGRDILGRAVSDVESNLVATLAPFAESQRNRRASLIPQLESLGLNEEERERLIAQAKLDAQFRKESVEAGQLQEFTIPLLQSIIELQPGFQPIVKGGGTSSITEFSSLIGPLLGAALQPKTPAGRDTALEDIFGV